MTASADHPDLASVFYPGAPGVAEPAIAAVVAKHRWFAQLSALAAHELWQASSALSLARGAAVYSQGQGLRPERDGFFVLLSGQLQVSSHTSKGRAAVLTFIHPGAWFGELALIQGGVRERTVSCVEDCELRVVSPEAFERLMANLEFSRAVARLIASRTQLLMGLLEDATVRSARARLARRLLLLSQSDDAHNSVARRELNISHDALALMLGVSRQSVATHMNGLREAGAVSQRYGRILITSDVALQAEASE